MNIKLLELIPRTISAVQFTGDNLEDLRQWVQDRLTFHRITATPERFYLPTPEGVDILEVGDWIFYDPQDQSFRGATDGAVRTHYREVTPAETGE